jgi:hypothetical protein
VSPGRWSGEAIAALTKAGVVTGYPDGTFNPAGYVTRAEFAAIAARFDGSGASAPDAFSDIGGHWAESYISRAAGLGWINGYEDGAFRPNMPVTRAETAALINRVLNRRPGGAGALLPGMKSWPDNADASKWYYIDMQEATNSHSYARSSPDGPEAWEALEN